MGTIYQKIKRIYYRSRCFHFLLFPAKAFWDVLRFRLLPDKIFLSILYKRIHGRNPDFKNPSTLNEKILWLKLYDKRNLLSDCADKYKVREYVKQVVGEKYLIPLVFDTKYPENITPEHLPDYPVIVKTNHNSGGNIIIFDKNKTDFKQLHQQLRKLFNENFYYMTKEYQYKNIERRIIVEKLLIDEQDKPPVDYKFHCLNGKVAFIQLDIDRFENHKRDFFDIKWNLLPFTWCPHENGKPIWINSTKPLNKPNILDEMIDVAERLADQFVYSRIDLYFHKNNIFFGEITFHHGSGNEIFTPIQYDQIYGDRLSLSLTKQ